MKMKISKVRPRHGERTIKFKIYQERRNSIYLLFSLLSSPSKSWVEIEKVRAESVVTRRRKLGLMSWFPSRPLLGESRKWGKCVACGCGGGQRKLAWIVRKLTIKLSQSLESFHLISLWLGSVILILKFINERNRIPSSQNYYLTTTWIGGGSCPFAELMGNLLVSLMRRQEKQSSLRIFTFQFSLSLCVCAGGGRRSRKNETGKA